MLEKSAVPVISVSVMRAWDLSGIHVIFTGGMARKCHIKWLSINEYDANNLERTFQEAAEDWKLGEVELLGIKVSAASQLGEIIKLGRFQVSPVLSAWVSQYINQQGKEEVNG